MRGGRETGGKEWGERGRRGEEEEKIERQEEKWRKEGGRKGGRRRTAVSGLHQILSIGLKGLVEQARVVSGMQSLEMRRHLQGIRIPCIYSNCDMNLHLYSF